EIVDNSFETGNKNEVIVKLHYMGICRADVKELTGSRDIPEDRGPLFGHEIIGEIEFAGSHTGYTRGTMVTFNPNITPNRTTGYAHFFKVTGDKDTLHEALIEIPAETAINPKWQPEPFACIVHSVNVLRHHMKVDEFNGKNIAVIGAGNSGTLFSMLFSHYGAQISVFNRGDERLSFVKEQGLLSEAKLIRLEEYESYKDTFDIVVVVPTIISDETLNVAHQMVKEEGVVFLYGGTKKADTYLNSEINIDSIRRNEDFQKIQFENKILYLAGAYGCGRDDFLEAFKLKTEYPEAFPVQKMVSLEVSLEDFPKLIYEMSIGEVDYPGKVIVNP
ncbi:MAG TPA: medium chain dehydrogenase/reductase family protein, partial [Candidatus Dojkabacteria bacterium]|nr:medium chain dehydrogenase/reductase family protein [Candidatus Dojkabacteria bacterium]